MTASSCLSAGRIGERWVPRGSVQAAGPDGAQLGEDSPADEVLGLLVQPDEPEGQLRTAVLALDPPDHLRLADDVVVGEGEAEGDDRPRVGDPVAGVTLRSVLGGELG